MRKSYVKKGLAVGVIYLFLVTTLPVKSATNNPNSLIYEKHMNNDLLYNNRTGIITHGPVMPLLNIATINISDGNPEQIEKIKRILDNRILQLILFKQEVYVTKLNFSISYNKYIPKNESWFFFRFRYHTYIQYDENNSRSINSVKHKLIFKEFEGTFEIGRPPFPFRFYPPYFVFIGACEEVIILT